MKELYLVFLLSLFVACGSNSTTPKEENLEANRSNEDNSSREMLMQEVNQTSEINSPLEENITVPSYTDEELTLVAGVEYARNTQGNSAKLVFLSFKGVLPLENNVPIVKADQNFSIELTWQNSAYAKNVNYYFFNGQQQSIQYLSFPLPIGVTSYKKECQMLGLYHYKCAGFEVDDAQFYEGRSFPVSSSFVMSVCDRSTQDPNRVCDFIRIPIIQRK